MKRSTIVKLVIITFCIIAGLWLYSENPHKVQGLAFQNIEALAGNEDGLEGDKWGMCIGYGDVDCLSLKVDKMIDNYSLNND